MSSERSDVPEVLPHPPAPLTLADTGLSLDLILQLTLKHMHVAGELTGSELAQRLGLRFSAIEPAVHALKSQHQLEVIGGAMIGPASFRYRITDAGRARVTIFLEHNQYVGVAPVPASRHIAYLKEWKRKAPRTATRDRLRAAFGHLVLGQRVLDQLGPAINAGHSLFVYGPPGNGKSVISQAIRNVLDGDIAIPHALEVEGQIVRLFDPVNHDVLPFPESEGLTDDAAPDRRWLRCRRPLVIDDFGRQQFEPRQFLNRWIVPLESRVDYLGLKTGQKFELPFNVMLVFATNLQPSTLVDEAFLRRIHYKVQAQSPTVAEFLEIFKGYCEKRGVPYQQGVVDEMLDGFYRPRGIALRGCQPRDLIEQALSLAEYLGEPEYLTNNLLQAACAGYFVSDEEPAPVYA